MSITNHPNASSNEEILMNQKQEMTASEEVISAARQAYVRPALQIEVLNGTVLCSSQGTGGGGGEERDPMCDEDPELAAEIGLQC